MNINESYVIDRLMQHYNWTNDDLQVLEAVSTDLLYGPTYILSADSEHIEDTIQIYDPNLGTNVPCYLGSWGADNIIGDFFPVGIQHVARMFDDVRSIFVNTEYDDVFFGSENGLWDMEHKHAKECTSFEEWVNDYASDSTANDPDVLFDEYETWLGGQVEAAIQDWCELELNDILSLFVGKQVARELIYHL